MTAGQERVTFLVDVKTREELAVLGGSEKPVYGNSISTEGRYLLAPFEGQHRYGYGAFSRRRTTCSRTRCKSVPRCLTGFERRNSFLDPAPPAWCIEMEKWPYQTHDWKDWLRYKRADADPPLPDTPQWRDWIAARKAN